MRGSCSRGAVVRSGEYPPRGHQQRGCQRRRHGNAEATINRADFISPVGIERWYPELASDPRRHHQRDHTHEEEPRSGYDKSYQKHF